MLYTKPLARLIEELEKLPGIGPKSSQRLAFHLVKQPAQAVQNLAKALVDAKEQIKFCSVCSNLSAEDPCDICRSTSRDRHVICVVAEPRDLVALERTREFKGTYHVLGGLISPLDGIGPEQLNIASLLTRAQSPEVKEILLALNATVEGQSTAHYISDQLASTDVTVSRLAQGVPIGGELDYLDDGTLAAAFKARRKL